MSCKGATAAQKTVDIRATVLPEDLKKPMGPAGSKKTAPKKDIFVKGEGKCVETPTPKGAVVYMSSMAPRLGPEKKPAGNRFAEYYSKSEFDGKRQYRSTLTLEGKTRMNGKISQVSIPLEGVISLEGGMRKEAPLGSGYRTLELRVNNAGQVSDKIFYLSDAQYKTYESATRGKNKILDLAIHEDNYQTPLDDDKSSMIAKTGGNNSKPIYKQSVGSLKSVPPPETKAAPMQKKEKEDELGRLIRESDEKWRTNRGKTDDSASTPGENRMKPFISEKANEWKTRPSAE